MYRQVRTTPRKQPRQERSKATVDTILEATARVLIKHGYDGLTTNAVAQLAGVSIGSLYQYFPNKEALVAGLIGRHLEEMHAAVSKELARVMEVQAITQQTIAALLTARRDELAIGDPEIAAFLLVSAIEAVAHRAVWFAPQRLRDPRLIDEATAMVTRYLGVADT